MNSISESEYSDLALRTATDRFNDKDVSEVRLRECLENFIEAAEAIGEIKSDLFYEKGLGWITERLNLSGKDLDPDLVHAILGIADEAGEIAQVLESVLDGEEVDRVNLIEERGDLEWFENLLDNNRGFFPGQIRAANIEKLSERFSDKFGDVSFSEEGALQRDRESERDAVKSAASQ